MISPLLSHAKAHVGTATGEFNPEFGGYREIFKTAIAQMEPEKSG